MERREAAEARRKLEEVIRVLEAQLRDYGLQSAVPIPPSEPQVGT